MLFLSVALAPAPAAQQSSCLTPNVRFEFNESVGTTILPSVPTHQQEEFKNGFCDQNSKVRAFFSGWFPPNAPGPLPPLPGGGAYMPRSDIQVFVSNEYEISQSLVPAWTGLRGRMLFPASEVIQDAAAVAHELTHVYLPNGNRMLAEGLAVYAQYRIRKDGVFPIFGRELHQLVRDFTCRNGQKDPAKLNGINLAAMDRIATPDEIQLRIGREPVTNAAFIYPIAGSFVQFLIENVPTPADGMETFRTLFLMTPLVPLERQPGLQSRWRDAYGRSLAELETQWKLLIASRECSQ